MIPAFLLTSHRAAYAEAAAFERDERARVYPARVKAGLQLEEDAEADHRAWAAITAWCVGETVDLDMSLATMELAAARALQTGERAVEKAPADPVRIARRDDLAAIYSMLSRTRAFIDDLNRDLRARAVTSRKAA